AERDAYYRHRCLKCHAAEACTAPVAERQAIKPPDSCIQCHMRPFATGEVAHTAVTDHRILRRPPSDHTKETTESIVYTPDDVVLFHRDLLTPAELPVVERDRAVLMSGSNNPALLEALAGTAQGRARGLTTLPMLDSALAAWPDDLAALEGKGSVLWM